MHTIVLERGVDGLGFSIVGGRGSPHGDLPIYVKTVFTRGPAAGRLQRGDQILAVNRQDVTAMRHDEAVAVLKRAVGAVELLVLSADATDVIATPDDVAVAFND